MRDMKYFYLTVCQAEFEILFELLIVDLY